MESDKEYKRQSRRSQTRNIRGKVEGVRQDKEYKRQSRRSQTRNIRGKVEGVTQGI